MLSKKITGFCFLLCFSLVQGADYNPYACKDAAQLRLAIAKLAALGSALYIGAHPDDENTGLIAYLAQERLFETAYLSITRGDGGQNLLGGEQAERLGLIRTQELLAARRIDGGRQFFTRAIDFGFSKSAQESIDIWGREQVLADMVWIIRRFQPDVIISRFAPNDGGGHGHHSASSILTREAFRLAADSTQYREQLSLVKPWQAKRLLWNGWRLSGEEAAKAVSLEAGGYNPLLGKSYPEIAGESRSMHKSQGFGSAERRGSRIEQFLVDSGEPASKDIFDGINTTWDRIPGAEKLDTMVTQILQQFQDEKPWASVPELLALQTEMNKLPNTPWVQRKQLDLLQVIQMAAGLWLEATTEDYRAVAGQPLKTTVAAVLRSDLDIELSSIRLPWQSSDSLIQQPLAFNRPLEIITNITAPASAPLSQPYWLIEPAGRGLYHISDLSKRGVAEPFSPLTVAFSLLCNGQKMALQIPLTYRWTDPVEGDNYRDVIISPAVTLKLDQPLYLFADNREKKISVLVRNHRAASSGTVRLQIPEGWRCQPEQRSFQITGKDAEQELVFTVQAPAAAPPGTIKAQAQLNGDVWRHDLVQIHYPHIPVQTWFPAAESRLLRLPNVTANRRIGYIMGSGDALPELLKQIGFQVSLLSDQDLESDLRSYDVIICGVRAYNTRPRLAMMREKLNGFMENGGIVIVQYNTDRRLVTEAIGPYPIRLSRDRVTVEEATVTLLQPQLSLWHSPFRIAAEDFNGWVQERGLNFAEQWDAKYEPLLSCADPGEKEKPGGMLMTRYGKGVFIFSSYAWFRQLPAGVPGAFKIFLNMIMAK